ncbi:MAG: putative beta-lysine N-acetyltransferase [Methanolobus sp.]|uniref:putative beta-lysine N-acetyltransferase n=1 Tax=Methanolobus sp. TaxID=1874737 RepID=UPI00272FABA1|nr:putative beta-lysine N-acetyltransferase [Methanolobus sp.]MDP2216718.1 putative beta-lysine N-acetyltransferase [Methanolobus sp.]
MTDAIIRLGDSVVQHGRHNDRVYLMTLSSSDFDPIHPVLEAMESLASENSYSKIFCKIPSSLKGDFLSVGYVEEAHIPGFFGGSEDASFMCRYFSQSRMHDESSGENCKVLDIALGRQDEQKEVRLPVNANCDICTPADVGEMADVFREVFPTYPFPVFDPEYLLQTMSEGFVYFCIRTEGRIVALSSCEMDTENRTVEMTDFATLPAYRGRGYSHFLLSEMEREMLRSNMLLAYTIARARSYGMNIVFCSNSYRYAGTLVNNTNISGGFESMNVWYKRL